MGLLITAFEPFGNDSSNISEALIRAIGVDSAFTSYDVSTLLLPVVYPAALDELIVTIETRQPHTVICLGQDNTRPFISVEKVAINLCDFDIPDNNGVRPVNEPVVAGGPVAYFSTLPISAMVQCMTGAGAKSGVSYSAGTYVCNALFYGLMHTIEEKSLPIRAGFMHIPGALKDTANNAMEVEIQFAALKQAIKLLSREDSPNKA